jgi:hypothetical protein
VRSLAINVKSVRAAIQPTSNGDHEGGAIPHLRFSCSLEGPKAVCRLPLEKQATTQQ